MYSKKNKLPIRNKEPGKCQKEELVAEKESVIKVIIFQLKS